MTRPEAKRFTVSLHGKGFDIAALHRKGKPPALFFIHALGGRKEQFLDAFTFPELAGHEIYLVDLQGFGESGKPHDFSYLMEAQAELLHELVRQLGLSSLIVVGHSMGGAIGLLLAERLGAACCKAFLNLEGNLTPADPVSSRHAARFSLEDFEQGGFDILREGFRQEHGKGPKFIVEGMACCTPLAYHKSSVSLVDWSDSGDLLWKFERLPCRKAYFYGDHTRSLEAVQDLEGGIDCIPVSRAGHFMMLDNPGECYAKLEEAISKASP